MILKIVGEYPFSVHDQNTLTEVALVEHQEYINNKHDESEPVPKVGWQKAQFSLPYLLSVSKYKSNLNIVVNDCQYNNGVPEIHQYPRGV